ncbi:MAG: hypothetical protein ABSG51_00615 [Terracidiphilus sp.]
MATKLIFRSSVKPSNRTTTPKLTVVHDMNDYPATAKCSSCGKEMPQRQRWINSSADNLAWFADQFRFHVEQEHSWGAESLTAERQISEADAA